MLLGFPPFDGADSYSVGYKQVHEQPVAPDVVDSRVPPALSAIVMRCLAKSAAERHQTGFGLADGLLAWLAADAEASGIPGEPRIPFSGAALVATRTARLARRAAASYLSPP
jgi:hypothetical protein